MDNFTKEFNNFISERIEHNISKLKKNIEYMQKYEEFEKKLNQLKKRLNKKQIEEIDYILSLHNFLSDYEITESYILGFKDSIKFNVNE